MSACVWFCLVWFALNAFMVVLTAVGGIQLDLTSTTFEERPASDATCLDERGCVVMRSAVLHVQSFGDFVNAFAWVFGN